MQLVLHKKGRGENNVYVMDVENAINAFIRSMRNRNVYNAYIEFLSFIVSGSGLYSEFEPLTPALREEIKNCLKERKDEIHFYKKEVEHESSN